MRNYTYIIQLLKMIPEFKNLAVDRPSLNAAKVGDSLSVMSKAFHRSAVKLRDDP